jgi:ferredoxin-NADP reductase
VSALAHAMPPLGGPPAAETEFAVQVRGLRWESEGVLSLTLVRADGGHLPRWDPGAHVDLHLPNGLIRQYSLNGPLDERAWRVSVLREADGRGGSAFVHDELRPGAELRVTGPRNNFPLQPADAYVFVAGGIGVTPLLPMIAAATEAGRPWQLLYGGRHRRSMAFAATLGTYGDRVRVHPQDEFGLLPLDEVLSPARPGTLVYCCGPAPLIQAVERACADWPSGSLHIERFASSGPVAPVAVGDEFDVECQRSGVTVHVDAQHTILQALEAAGLTPPSSCQEGICGTCETKVLGGVPDHRDELMSESERASNRSMMICVSRCRRGPLVLDI